MFSALYGVCCVRHKSYLFLCGRKKSHHHQGDRHARVCCAVYVRNVYVLPHLWLFTSMRVFFLSFFRVDIIKYKFNIKLISTFLIVSCQKSPWVFEHTTTYVITRMPLNRFSSNYICICRQNSLFIILVKTANAQCSLLFTENPKKKKLQFFAINLFCFVFFSCFVLFPYYKICHHSTGASHFRTGFSRQIPTQTHLFISV